MDFRKGGPALSDLHPISGCDQPHREADVVFVHGLGGDPFLTWQGGADKASSWPHWLGLDFPQVGVWSIGYPASPSSRTQLLSWFSVRFRDTGHAMALPDRAAQLLDRMVQYGIGQRPLMLICHSLGGLVAKEILRASSDDPTGKWSSVFSSTRAVLFLATPHTGSSLASLLSRFRTIFGPTVALDDLRAHDARLRNLLDWYRNHALPQAIRTTTYYEGRSLKGVTIVNPSSSHPGVGDNPIALEEDHISIAKPRQPNAQVCVAARDLLCRYVLAIPVIPSQPQSSPEAIISPRIDRDFRLWKVLVAVAVLLAVGIGSWVIYSHSTGHLQKKANDQEKGSDLAVASNDNPVRKTAPNTNLSLQSSTRSAPGGYASSGNSTARKTPAQAAPAPKPQTANSTQSRSEPTANLVMHAPPPAVPGSRLAASSASVPEATKPVVVNPPLTQKPMEDAVTLSANAHKFFLAGKYDEAFPLADRACQQGEAAGCATAGLMYQSGNGVPKNPSQAVISYGKACTGGDASGCNWLGLMYDEGRGGVTPNKVEALSDYEKSCKGQYAIGCFNLGHIYEAGDGIPPDKKKAYELYQKACDGNDGAGCELLGRRYILLPSTQSQGVDFLRKACELHDSEGCDRLGSFYFEQKDYPDALTFLGPACDANLPNSCGHLGQIYEHSPAFPNYKKQALQLYTKACTLGDSEACKRLKHLKL